MSNPSILKRDPHSEFIQYVVEACFSKDGVWRPIWVFHEDEEEKAVEKLLNERTFCPNHRYTVVRLVVTVQTRRVIA